MGASRSRKTSTKAGRDRPENRRQNTVESRRQSRPEYLRQSRAENRPEGRCEAEVLPGLAQFAAAELEGLGAQILDVGDDAISFRYSGPREGLLGLRRTVSVHEVLRFEVPRPKAFLGHEHLTRLTELVTALRRGPPPQSFDGFRFGAAGSDSPVFSRLAVVLSKATGLAYEEEGELLLRFRPASGGGWDVLGRITPRPLSARSWRECNLPGGLNATVAAAALDLLGNGPDDSFLNLMCGSGTLLVERGLLGDWDRGVALDIDRRAVECARRNIEAAGLAATTELLQADATALPFPERSFDRLCADLPWGDVVGDHSENARLYPAFLAEAARVAKPRARLLAITHEIRLFTATVGAQKRWRQLSEPVRVFHGGHRPGLYLLELTE